MSESRLRNQVIKLRGRGYTYAEILDELDIKISKSTLSLWCRHVPLPSHYYAKLEKLSLMNREKGLTALKQKNSKELEELLQTVRHNNQNLLQKFKLDKEFQKLVLSILYLCQGAKWKTHRGLQLSSSDPLIISLYVKLLLNVYAIPKFLLRAHILYRAGQDRDELIHFWSEASGLPEKVFYNTKPDSRTREKNIKNVEYKGVCVISCAGSAHQLELEELAKLAHKKILVHPGR